MPERPDEAGPTDADQPSEVARESDSEPTAHADGGGACADADTEVGQATDPADGETDAGSERQARLEAAKRRYRATLRNEADSGGGGFSEDYYRSQKPPHWS